MVVFPLLAWASFALFDQPLLPGAKAVLETPVEAVPDVDNLFLAMLALPIAGDEPAHERGAAAVAAYQRALRKGGVPPKNFAEALDRPLAVIDDQDVEQCSGGNREGAYACIAMSRRQRPDFEALLVRYQILLGRYRELSVYPRFADPLKPSPDTPLANAAAILISSLHLSWLALAAAEGAPNTAAIGMAQSAEIWRRVLAARDVSLLDKLIASRLLAAHTLLASELIREEPLDAQGLAAIETLIRPLSETERSLAGALAMEFRLQSAVWTRLLDPSGDAARKDFPSAPAWWFRLLAKTNATINLAFHDLEQVLAVERSGCVGVKARSIEARLRPAPTASDLPWHAYFYNPIGRILLTTTAGVDPYLDYLGRQCNLLALQRMVGLQLELRQSGNSAEGTAAAVAGSRFQDPNSGKPFIYDADAQTLAFNFIGREKQFLNPLPLRAP